MVWELGLDRLTVKMALAVPLFPSITVTSLMLIDGAGSSLSMVPIPWLSAMVALVAPERVTWNLSLGLTLMSPLTWSVIVLFVWPGVIVPVTVLFRYSLSASVAVPSAVA